jgi:hypothetical protein
MSSGAGLHLSPDTPARSSGWPAAQAEDLLQCLLLSIRRAFESPLRHADLPSPAAIVRLRQLLPLHAMQFGHPFAFLSLAQPRLLRGRELPLFQGFKITVPGHSLSFAAIDDGVRFSRIVRLAFEERDGPANQAFTVCAMGRR